MKPYFSTFPAGTESLVEKALKVLDPKAKMRHRYSGLVLYESLLPAEDIRQIRFFQNSFASLYQAEGTFPLKDILNRLRADEGFIKTLRQALPHGARSFKLVASIENQTIAIPHIQGAKLETYIAEETGLKVEKSAKRPDADIWIIGRREGLVLAGLRLTYPDAGTSKPERGELSPELAHILCLASDPTPEDAVLDPFAGHGGIVFERARAFPYRKIIAVEKDLELVKKMQERAAKIGKNMAIEAGDAQALKMADASVDAIITDPPWGMFNKEDIQSLYTQMLKEFGRVLKPEGRAVVLTGAKDEFEKAVSHNSQLHLIEKTDILVSGKKAAIYKLRVSS